MDLLTDPHVLIGQLLSLAFLLFAVYAITWILGRFDKRMGLDFRREIVPHLRESPLAAALYLGLRFVGSCYLVGTLLR